MRITQDIRLQIRRAERAPMVDDQAFPCWHASIALSNELRAVFTHQDKLLTHAELELLGISSTELWDLAAERTTTAQVRIRTHHICGIEIATDTGSAVDWLAHPHSYWLLHMHLEHLLGHSIVYFLPTQDELVACPWAPRQLGKLQTWAAQTFEQAGRLGLLPHGVIYQYGYPTSLSQEFALAY